MTKRDYREVKGLKSYIYNPDTNLGDYELCPGCDGAFKTSDIEIVDMQDGDYDYGVCPIVAFCSSCAWCQRIISNPNSVLSKNSRWKRALS